MKKLLLFAASLIPMTLLAQTSITSFTTYSQDFNTLENSVTTNVTWTDNTTVPGWYSNKTTYNSGTGSSTTGALYSFGVAGTNPVTDRCLGGLVSGTTNTIYYGWLLENNAGADIKSINITYTGEQWRQAGTTPQTTYCEYKVGDATLSGITTGTWTAISPLDFTSPTNAGTGLLDGNSSANRVNLSYTFNLTIPVGGRLFIRWRDPDDSGNDHGLGIDDVSFTAYQTLPVSLLSFTGKETPFGSELNWSTASEQNNSHFEILRSEDGQLFNKIGEVPGSNNSTSTKAYSYKDKSAFSGINYYQLKQVDFDGQSKIYGPIAVKSGLDPSQHLTAYATSTSLEVGLTSENIKTVDVLAYDLGGHQLAKANTRLSRGYNSISLPMLLEKGVYLLRIIGNGSALQTKFIKQ